jgi:hypothetical protein
MGLASLVWPRVTIHVTPAYELVHVMVPIKIDLDVSEPVLASSVLPGQLLAAGGKLSSAELKRSYFIDLSRGEKLSVARTHVQQLVDAAVRQVAGEDYASRPGTQNLVWQPVTPGRSGRLYTCPLAVEQQVYRIFPLAEWHARLAGLSLVEAKRWLVAEEGVAAVSIDLYPAFLAKISQKLPKNVKSITFSLDTK